MSLIAREIYGLKVFMVGLIHECHFLFEGFQFASAFITRPSYRSYESATEWSQAMGKHDISSSEDLASSEDEQAQN